MKYSDEYFLNGLTPEQRTACTFEGSALLQACPGSGKTHTVVHRLALLSARHHPSRLLNVALTYTNRAAMEMQNRLELMGMADAPIWTGTIHAFCLEFILRPYAALIPPFSRGYRIIDEYESQDLIKSLIEAHPECGAKFSPYNRLEDYPPALTKLYAQALLEQRLIDFDRIVVLSKMILRDNPQTARALASRLRSLHIDEYQDTHQEHYEIVAALARANAQLRIMFIGDPNQAIYRNLGGLAKSKEELESLLGRDLSPLQLTHCRRSTQRLIDYYRNFAPANNPQINSSAPYTAEKGVICYDHKTTRSALPERIAALIQTELNEGTAPEQICVAAHSWFDIYYMGRELRRLLRELQPELTFDAPEVSPFKYNPLNPLFLLATLLFTRPGELYRSRCRIAEELLRLLVDTEHLLLPKGFDKFALLETLNAISRKAAAQESADVEAVEVMRQAVTKLFEICGTPPQEQRGLTDRLERYLKEAKQRFSNYGKASLSAAEYNTLTFKAACSFYMPRGGVVLSTLHGLKGEEYDTVIAFSLLEGKVPFWKEINKDPVQAQTDARLLLYVLCSRPRRHLYLFSENRVTKKNREVYAPTQKLRAVTFGYDAV